MSKEIKPGDFLTELPFQSIIRTACAQEFVTEKQLLRLIGRENMACGDAVLVQCFNHTMTKLLAESEWRVVVREDYLDSTEKADFSMHQEEKHRLGIEQKTDWWVSKSPEAAVAARAEAAPRAKSSPTKRSARWDSDKSHYNIIEDGRVIGFHKDKETAQRIADGTLELNTNAY